MLEFSRTTGVMRWTDARRARPPRRPMGAGKKILLTLGIMMGLGAFAGNRVARQQIEKFENRPLIFAADQPLPLKAIEQKPTRPQIRFSFEGLGNGWFHVNIFGPLSGSRVRLGMQKGCGALIVGEGEKISEDQVRFTIDAGRIRPGSSCDLLIKFTGEYGESAVVVKGAFSNKEE